MKMKSLQLLTPWKRILKKANILANTVDVLKDKYSQMSDDQLSSMTDYFLSELANGKTLDEILPDALAVAREAIYRVHGLYAYHVQVIGAIIVHNGDFAEMYTGEGKTLTILLVAYLNALTKKGVHIVTVNEYLVKRDAEFCAQALNPLKITVGYNLTEMNADVKRKMYACDIIYTTNSELGFDYLRDNMVGTFQDKVIRELNFAIVDEADSVLIDEARTPLIISGQPKKDVSLYLQVDEFTKTLTKDDYKIDPESNSINLTDQGINKCERYYKLANLFDVENSDLVHKLKNAMMANFIFRYGVEYIVRDDKILLVDHFTGRILEGRSYNAGLHQAIQAKERVKIEPENVIVATITYQAFFRLYHKLAGVSGTAFTENEEFIKIYNMVVVPIPTNKKNQRKDLNDYVFYNKDAKWKHVAAEIERIHKTGQPILVGTSSVEDSEELAILLRNLGFKFELLNAKNHAREAEIVKNAGQLNSITIATNMAGRGTDIKLGPGVKELGGLFVIGTDHHESRRVDNQLRGRSGRQGDPGITRFFISLDDVLFKRYAGKRIEKANDKIADDDYFDSWFFNKLLISMQKKVEGINFDVRKNLIDYDIVLSNQRELVYKQRDQILKNESNLAIIKNMKKHVASDITQIFIDKKNPNFVNSTELVHSLNKRLLFADILPSNLFENLMIKDVESKVENIILISVNARIEALNKEQINSILRSIMIQNLDNQWTNHLDKMGKIREGVSLRSLEQRSPLHIYVEEADKNFNMIRKNIAHQTIISIHRLFIPNIANIVAQKLFDANIISQIDLDNFNSQKEIKVNRVINSSISEKPSFKIELGPKSPKDKPLNDLQKSEDAKKRLIEKMNEIKNKQKEEANKDGKEPEVQINK